MYYAQFYHRGVTDNRPIPACGDRAVIVLDGRNRISDMQDIARKTCRERGYIGFTICQGDTIARGEVIQNLDLISLD